MVSEGNSAGGYLFPPAFATMMERHLGDQLERELLWAMSGPFGAVTEEQKLKAKTIREQIVSEGRLMEVLEATMPKPCPTCGEMPR